MENNSLMWFDPYLTAKDTSKRLQTPIHYHLEKLDFMAAQAEIRRGTDPCVMDENGKTPMDVIIEMYIDIMQTAFCTSYAVDYLNESLYRSFRIPRYEESYKNLNQQAQYFRYTGYAPYPCNMPNTYIPTLYPQPASLVCPAYSNIPAKRHTKQRVIRERKTAGGAQAEEISTNMYFPLPDDVIHRNSELTECQLIQQDVLLVVENALLEPIPKKIWDRMQSLLKRLRAVNQFMKLLAGCECLRKASFQTAALGMECISFPFLYIALLHCSFNMYPFDLSGRPWDPLNPADARQLVSIIINKEMRGHEIFRFLGAIPKYLIEFIQFFGPSVFRISPSTAQYWMHMGLVLDSPKLFEFAANQPNIFSVDDIFKWDDLVHILIPNRTKFPRITSQLISTRLKARLQKRLSASDEKSEKMIPENITAPYEERYLKSNVIDEYAELFGRKDVLELERLVRDWKYGVYRTSR